MHFPVIVCYSRKRKAKTILHHLWESRWKCITNTQMDDGITSKFKKKNVPAKLLCYFSIKASYKSYSCLEKQ